MAAGIAAAIGAELFKGIVGNGPALLETIDSIVSKHVEDPNKRAQIALEMQKLVSARDMATAQQAADLAQSSLAAATQLNVESAKSAGWEGRWRDAIGWTVAIGVFFGLIVQPFVTWVMTFISAWKDTNYPPPPDLNWQQISMLLGVLITGTIASAITGKAIGPK